MAAKKTTVRELQVVRKVRVTPNMLRVSLGGPDIAGFPNGRESANFKLLIPASGEKPITRTYTVRNYRRAAGEVDVDFMLHGDPGPASDWAIGAKPGDAVGFAGPGSSKLADMSCDWFIFAGDMSALPAIGANIERLPEDALGYAVLEILSEEDRQPLPFPDGFEVQWLVNPEPTSPNRVLLEAVTTLPWLSGTTYAWIAGESTAIRSIRRYFVNERGLDKRHFYASGYWQIGFTEDKHQLVKRQLKST